VVSHATLLYDDLTAEENLQLFAGLYGVPGATALIEECLRSVGIFSRRGDLVRGYSRGMRQRLALARALLHQPDLLLLDEPATGLDRDGLAHLREQLALLHAAGCTILLSTHQMTEAQGLATRAVMLADGSLAREFDPRHASLAAEPGAGAVPEVGAGFDVSGRGEGK
jgi:ABC-type multidrug transport system ATPase subunit